MNWWSLSAITLMWTASTVAGAAMFQNNQFSFVKMPPATTHKTRPDTSLAYSQNSPDQQDKTMESYLDAMLRATPPATTTVRSPSDGASSSLKERMQQDTTMMKYMLALANSNSADIANNSDRRDSMGTTKERVILSANTKDVWNNYQPFTTQKRDHQNTQDVVDFARELRSHKAVEKQLQQQLHAALDAYTQAMQQQQQAAKEEQALHAQEPADPIPVHEPSASISEALQREEEALSTNAAAFNKIVEQSRREFQEWLGKQVPMQEYAAASASPQSRREFQEWLGQQVPIDEPSQTEQMYSNVDMSKQRSAQLLKLEEKLDFLESQQLEMTLKRQMEELKGYEAEMTKGSNLFIREGFETHSPSGYNYNGSGGQSMNRKPSYGGNGMGGWGGNKSGDPRDPPPSERFDANKKSSPPMKSLEDHVNNAMNEYMQLVEETRQEEELLFPTEAPVQVRPLENEIDAAMDMYTKFSAKRRDESRQFGASTTFGEEVEAIVNNDNGIEPGEITMDSETLELGFAGEIDTLSATDVVTSMTLSGESTTVDEISVREILNGASDYAEESPIAGTSSLLNTKATQSLKAEAVIDDAASGMIESDYAVAKKELVAAISSAIDLRVMVSDADASTLASSSSPVEIEVETVNSAIDLQTYKSKDEIKSHRQPTSVASVGPSSLEVNERQELDEYIDNVIDMEVAELDSSTSPEEDLTIGKEDDAPASADLAPSSETDTSQRSAVSNEQPAYWNLHGSVKADLSNVFALGQGEFAPDQPHQQGLLELGQGVVSNGLLASITTQLPNEVVLEAARVPQQTERKISEPGEMEEPIPESREALAAQNEMSVASKTEQPEGGALNQDVSDSPLLEQATPQAVQLEVDDDQTLEGIENAHNQMLASTTDQHLDEVLLVEKTDAKPETVDSEEVGNNPSTKRMEATAMQTDLKHELSSSTATKQAEEAALREEVDAALAAFNEAMDAMEAKPQSKIRAPDIVRETTKTGEQLWKSVQTAQEFLREKATAQARTLGRGEDILKSVVDTTKGFFGTQWHLSPNQDRASAESELPYFADMKEPSVVVFDLNSPSQSSDNTAKGKTSVAISKDSVVVKSLVERKPEISQELFNSIADINGGELLDSATLSRDTQLPEGVNDCPSITRRILSKLPHGGQSTAWSAFQKLDRNWAKLRGSKPFKYDKSWLQRVQQGIPPPYPFVTEDGTIGNPLCWAKLREQEDKELDYDVVVAGGTLGVFFGMALLLKGEKVCVIEGADIRICDQGWNLSMEELFELKNLGILTQEDMDPNIAPSTLVQRVADRFTALGGVLMQGTPIFGVTISEFTGAAVDLGSDQEPLTANLIIDCLGNDSPITRQSRYGQKPDGICFMVGSCVDGFDKCNRHARANVFTSSAMQKNKEQRATQQYFWVASPLGVGNAEKGDTPTTTYMCTFMDADENRPSLESMMNEYWHMLQLYDPSIANPETDLDIKRVLFAYYPTYRDSPLKPQWSRLLSVGDASGVQSPLSFGGFGAFTRNLGRISSAVAEAVETRCLHKDDLCKINAYRANASADWLAQKTMSARIGQQGVDPDLVSRLFATAFKSEGVDSSIIKPLLRDLILKDPTILPKLIQQVGLPTLMDWLYHVGMMGVYGVVDNFSPEIETLVNKVNDPRSKFTWRRRLDAWKVWSGTEKGPGEAKGDPKHSSTKN